MTLGTVLVILPLFILLFVFQLKRWIKLPKEYAPQVVAVLTILAALVVSQKYKADYKVILATLTSGLSSGLLFDVLKRFGVEL